MADYAVWLSHSLRRVYPGTPASATRQLTLRAARNERLSFQACARNLGAGALDAHIMIEAPDDLGARARRVGYVPVAHFNTDTPADELDGIGHAPGFVPDPLFADDHVQLGPFETHAFWITVSVPADIAPGPREVRVTFTLGEHQRETLSATIDVRPVTVAARHDFPVTHWFYADALCDWHKLEPFEEKFWEVVKPYMRNLAEHGTDCQYVPIFTPPTDGVKRPTQLLNVTEPAPGSYYFDFSNVRRWVRLARECGARYFEWTHLFTQWGAQHAIRVYRNSRNPDSLLWPADTAATSDKYRNFLSQFLPQFHVFLTSEHLLDVSFFHVSDEPGAEHLDNYRAARRMLAELAPWMKVSDALSHIEYGREGLTDTPIPIISAAREYRAAGIPAWVYYCCGPRGRYVQRLMDTPLPKIRMNGWLFYKLDARGFLHWGYNYWHKSQTRQLIDPFTEQAGLAWPGWAYGDPFVVYPGPNGPIDSLRWEVFAESLQDYALLQSLGIARDDARLAGLNDYDDFPKTAEWILATRDRLLATPEPATLNP